MQILCCLVDNIVGDCKVPPNQIPLLKDQPQIRIILLIMFSMALSIWWGIERNKRWGKNLRNVVRTVKPISMLPPNGLLDRGLSVVYNGTTGPRKFVIHKRQIWHKERPTDDKFGTVFETSLDFWYYLLCGEDNVQWLRSFGRLNNTKMKLLFVIIMI